MGSAPSECTCLTRACGYNKKKSSDTTTEEGPAENSDTFDADISKMITKTLDKKNGAKIVSDKSVYKDLKDDIKDSHIPRDLLITGSCIGFCDAVEAKCTTPKTPEPTTPSTDVTASTEATKEGFRRRRSFVSCTTLVIALTAIALLMWRVARWSQRKPSAEVSIETPTNVATNALTNTARLSDANA